MTVETSPRIVRTRRAARFLAIVAIVSGCASGSAVPAPGAIDNAAAVTGAGTAVPAAAVSAAAVFVSPLTYSVGHLAIRLTRQAGTFSSPVFIANAHDGTGRLFIVEQGGRIRIIDGGAVPATPFLDIHTKVSCCGERGLLGLAFHPSYATNGRFFVDYTDVNGNTVVAEYHRSPSDPNLATNAGTILFRITQPYSNHNGGMLAFGKDGYLYVGMGDGGSAGDPGNRAQNKYSLLGKILRIDVNHRAGTAHYAVPRTNPFVGHAGDDRIWAYGLRNPWRFSFDRSTGDLWIGDVGQDRYEEVDRSTRASGGGRGANYGWRVMEGRACFSPMVGCSKAGKVLPITTYTHRSGCAIVGGYVYRGSLYPAMVNAYLLADYCSGRIWALVANGSSSQAARIIIDTSLVISSFGESENGTLYVADLAGGGIYALVGASR
jgi:glucose/arabinose dehydrogenase